MPDMKIDKFLEATKYCDVNNPLIQDAAIHITAKFNNNREKSVALFNYVRDNILYKFDHWNVKASQTLKKGYGMCTNKNNLFIAMLRAIGIPAGYGILDVKAREYFGPIMLSFFKDKIAEKSVHIYSQVYLNDKWIKCDSSTDKILSDRTAYFNYTTELVHWDGYNDAMDKILPEHILTDTGVFSNIDERLGKKPRNITFMKISIGNLYLDFLRQHSQPFKDEKDKESRFLSWLRSKNPIFYLYFKTHR